MPSAKLVHARSPQSEWLLLENHFSFNPSCHARHGKLYLGLPSLLKGFHSRRSLHGDEGSTDAGKETRDSHEAREERSGEEEKQGKHYQWSSLIGKAPDTFIY